jgi:hypothetical protein
MSTVVADKTKKTPVFVPNGKLRLSDVATALVTDRYFTVNAKSSNQIFISRVILGRPRTVTLTIEDSNLIIKAPRYKNVSTTSFFDFTEDEIRLTRNKNTIEIFINRLKKIGIWKHIENKNFFFVNVNNRKLNRDKAFSLMNKIKK